MEIKEIRTFLKSFLKMIRNVKNVFIFHHVNPDGDCLGSQFGLKKWLEDMFIDKNIYAIGNNLNLFPFFEWDFDNNKINEITDSSVAIMVDGNYSSRINEYEVFKNIKYKIRIDHHPELDDIDYDLRFVDESYSSSCEQISHLIYLHNNKNITQDIAKYLYLGIYTDSGRFFYDKTSSRTHMLTSFLMSSKLNIYEIHKHLAKRTLDEIEFNKYVFENYKIYKNVIYCFIKQSDLKKLNIPDASQNRVDFLANIEGYNVWIFFIENEDGSIRVRLRSNELDISQIARQFNGGGHKKASGAIIYNKEDINKIVELASNLNN